MTTLPSLLSHSYKTMYATTTHTFSPIPLPNIFNGDTLVGAPTPSPTPAIIPLPPSGTHTEASTQVTSPTYIPYTPSPINPWMPTTKDINSN